MENNFFEGEIATGGGLYTKLKQGDNKLRIVSPTAVLMWEGWYNNKPVRFASNYKITPDEYATLDKYQGSEDRSKWRQIAVVTVWNYDTQSLQLWSFHQKKIMESIRALSLDPDWGNLNNYDIKIKRSGDGLETTYEVLPVNKTPLPQEVLDQVENGPKPGHLLTDNKNIENINVFKEAVAKSNGSRSSERDSEINPDDIPF